ncbi:hypothetical protein VUR80DRAFT_4546 [Thermomyces stellatus]
MPSGPSRPPCALRRTTSPRGAQVGLRQTAGQSGGASQDPRRTYQLARIVLEAVATGWQTSPRHVDVPGSTQSGASIPAGSSTQGGLRIGRSRWGRLGLLFPIASGNLRGNGGACANLGLRRRKATSRTLFNGDMRYCGLLTRNIIVRHPALSGWGVQ